MLEILQKRLPLILLILFSSILFFYAYRPAILIPTFLDHILYGDPAIHYLGWAFFRNTPWHFPLGQIEGYFHPYGTNVGFTDSIPLLAIPLKIVSPLLPANFQYLGIWFYLCYLLQGIMSFNLFKEVGTKNNYVILLASCLLVLSSPLLYRNAHPALSSHWLLIGSIWCYMMTPSRRSWQDILKLQALWLLLSSWIHPYLAVMVLGLSIAVILNLSFFHKVISVGQTILFGILAPTLLFLNWVLIGYFDLSLDAAESTGYGVYAANLNAFWNPMEFSSLFSGLSLPPGHFEGYAYMGLGGLCVMLVGGLLSFPMLNSIWKNFRKWLPIVLLMIGFGLFSLSHLIYWNEELLIQMPYPRFWMELGGTFRASGRFIWPVFYVLLIWGLTTLIHKVHKERILIAGLGVLLLVQLIDIFPLIQRLHDVKAQTPNWNIQLAAWEPIISSAEEVQSYPPFMEKYITNREDCIPFLYLAQKHKTPITMGPVARRDVSEITRFTINLKQQLEEQGLRKGVVYVLPETEIELIQKLMYSDKLKVGFIDKYYLFCLKDSDPALLASMEQEEILQSDFPVVGFQTIGQFMDVHHDKLILMAAMDEATYGLDLAADEAFGKRGSQLGALPFRGSFLTIIHNDRVIHEQFNETQQLSASFQAGENIEEFQLPVSISLMSAGSHAGSDASIRVNGQELAPKARGLNIAVLDSAGEVIEVAHFDTYSSSIRKLE